MKYYCDTDALNQARIIAGIDKSVPSDCSYQHPAFISAKDEFFYCSANHGCRFQISIADKGEVEILPHPVIDNSITSLDLGD